MEINATSALVLEKQNHKHSTRPGKIAAVTARATSCFKTEKAGVVTAGLEKFMVKTLQGIIGFDPFTQK